MKQESTSERVEKLVRMTTEPVEKLVCKLALPTIISMLVSTFYNMADTYFVGKIGYMSGSVAEQAAVQTRATAAVGVVFSLMAGSHGLFHVLYIRYYYPCFRSDICISFGASFGSK